MRKVFGLLAFHFIVFSFSLAHAEEVDLSSLYECDDFFCPGQGEAPADQMLRENIGIVVPPVPTINFQPRRVIINDRGQTSPGRSRGTASAPDLIDDGSDVSGVPEESSFSTQSEQQTEDPDTPPGSFNQQNSGLTAGQGGGFTNPQGGGISAASVPPGGGASSGSRRGNFESGFKGNQANVKGGLLYADDPQTETNPIAKTPTSPIEQDQKTGKSNSQGGAFAASGTGGMQTPPASNGVSRSPTSATEKPDGLLGRLKNIATNLGEKFFGLSGSGSKNKNQRNAIRNSRALANNKGQSERGSTPDMRKLLQNRLNQYRGLASHLEFAKSNTHLFGNMCKHYQAYAQKHRIPNDKSACPD